MKKHLTRNIILMLVLDVVLGIVLALYIAPTRREWQGCGTPRA